MTLDELSWASVDQSVNVGISIHDIKYKPSCILANDRHVTVLFNSFSGITTSRIVGKTSDNKVITKSGSVYELGVVLPDYEQHFPNARDRLLNTLPNLR